MFMTSLLLSLLPSPRKLLDRAVELICSAAVPPYVLCVAVGPWRCTAILAGCLCRCIVKSWALATSKIISLLVALLTRIMKYFGLVFPTRLPPAIKEDVSTLNNIVEVGEVVPPCSDEGHVLATGHKGAERERLEQLNGLGDEEKKKVKAVKVMKVKSAFKFKEVVGKGSKVPGDAAIKATSMGASSNSSTPTTSSAATITSTSRKPVVAVGAGNNRSSSATALTSRKPFAVGRTNRPFSSVANLASTSRKPFGSRSSPRRPFAAVDTNRTFSPAPSSSSRSVAANPARQQAPKKKVQYASRLSSDFYTRNSDMQRHIVRVHKDQGVKVHLDRNRVGPVSSR